MSRSISTNDRPIEATFSEGVGLAVEKQAATPSLVAHAVQEAPAMARVIDPPSMGPETISVPKAPWEIRDWARKILDGDTTGLSTENTLGRDAVGVDTETTGFKGTIIEIGLVDGEGNQLYHAYVQPLTEIDPRATAVHGYTAESLEALGARPWSEVSPEVNEVLAGRTVVQYSFSFFDKEMIENTDRAAGLTTRTDDGVKAWVDAQTVAQVAAGDHKPMKLIEAAKSAGVPLTAEEAHGALADARAMMGVFRAAALEAPKVGEHEVFVRLNRKGDPEAFDAAGSRVVVDAATLNEAIGKAMVERWEKPKRAMENLNAGGYVRLELPESVEIRPLLQEPDAIYLIENDNLGDDWVAFKTYEEAEAFVRGVAREVAAANVDAEGMSTAPRWPNMTRFEIEEAFYEAEQNSILKRIGGPNGDTEPQWWYNPAAKELDLMLKSEPRGARAEGMSHKAILAGGVAVESGVRLDHDDAKTLHLLAAEEHRGFARNYNPEVAAHSNRIATLHELAASWHEARGTIFAKPSDFLTPASTDAFYLRKYGEVNPPERRATDRAIAGKAATVQDEGKVG